MKTRPCYKCKLTFPLTAGYFRRNKTLPEGFQYECKGCKNASDTTYRQLPENKARRKIYDQTPERKDKKRAYRQSPEGKAKARVYRQLPEVKARTRTYRQSPKGVLAKHAYYLQNKNKTLARVKAYQQTLAGKVSHSNTNHTRRSIYRTTDITTAWLKELYKNSTHCIYCGRRMVDYDLTGEGKFKTLDHLIPISRGGGHFKDNVQVICGRDNNWKRALSEDAFCYRYMKPDWKIWELKVYEYFLVVG